MEQYWKTSLWQQFGAAIDMLDNALLACPDELWSAVMWDNAVDPPELSQFWYIGYHTLFWLDLYLDGAVEGFAPPTPFSLDELDPAGLLPPRIYSKAELRLYLAYCRQKCQSTIIALSDERAQQLCTFGWGEVIFAELLLDNMRHVQEHAAQLNMFLGQKRVPVVSWVARVRNG